MRYTRPRIIRMDDAVLVVQSVSKPDSQKNAGSILDNAQTMYATAMSYEADE